MDFCTRDNIANNPDEDNDNNYAYDPAEQPLLAATQQAQMKNEEGRQKAKEFLESKSKHYIILAMVALDVAGILADIFITLVACDLGKKNERWVRRSEEILYVCWAGVQFAVPCGVAGHCLGVWFELLQGLVPLLRRGHHRDELFSRYPHTRCRGADCIADDHAPSVAFGQDH